MITVRPSRQRSLEEFEHLLARAGIEIAGRLVGQNDGWVVGQRSCEGHPLLLADAQFARLVVACGRPGRRGPSSVRGPRQLLRLRRDPASISGTWTFSSAVRYGIRLNV